jgi:Rrf2 family transcriptional regulator, cysteine metabolism repressor
MPRMRTTAASEYGCLALLTIAENESGWCKRQQVIDRFDVPRAFLEQILRRLATAGFIESRRGADGGFRLARPAADISIAAVMRAMDGPLAPTRSVSPNFYEPSPVEASPAFHALFRRVRDAVAEILESETLEDIVAKERTIRRTATRHRRSTSDRAAARRPRS